MEELRQLISVILPTYNRANTIGKAIESVLEQSYQEFELIIVDDGSTDHTSEILQNFCDKRISYCKQKTNKGANSARNIGIKLAKGNWIAFIDSDNVWKRDKLTKQADIMQAAPENIGIVYCAFNRIENSDTKYIPSKMLAQIDKEENILDIMYKENLIDTNTVLIRKVCFEKIGVFDETFPRMQDWEMFFRVIGIGNYGVKFIDEALVDNYIQKDSVFHDGDKYIVARLLFLKKYLDGIIKNDKVNYYINEILHYPCENLSINERVNKLEEIFQEKQGLLLQNMAVILENEMIKKNKFKLYYEIMEKWMRIRQQGILLRDYFANHKYETIAIYGMGNLGRTLLDELLPTNIYVAYIIDRVNTINSLKIKVISAQEEFEKVDVIVVTAINDYCEIKEKIRVKGDFDIVSLEDIVREMASEN